MTRVIKFFLVAVLIAGALLACDTKNGSDSGKPLVYASFFPMYDLASKAAGDFAEVRCLIPDGAEPHDWEPSPQDIVGLEHADLFVYSGADFEQWVTQVLPQVQNGKLKPIETSQGIELSQGDPHVWLSPKNARQQFTLICEALKEIDPANSAGYEENMLRWQGEFDKLDAEFSGLRKLGGKSVVVAHEAFGYLCGEYGLTQISPLGYSPDSEPDPASMALVIAHAKELGIKTVFYENSESLRSARAIAAEIGAETALLSPLEGLSEEDRANGGDYFSVMRKNLDALKEALE